MKLTKIQKIGIIAILLGIILGAGGTIWGIASSFEAVSVAENAGIGAVGVGIMLALFFSAVGLASMLIGLVLLVLGRRRT